MSNWITRPISIPKFLHDVHGRESTRLDVMLTYSFAVMGTIALYVMARPLDLAWWRQLLLIGLSLDLAGGVIANFSQGTQAYYGAKPKKRIRFILGHITQPLGLVVIFPEYAGYTVPIVAYILASALLINARKGTGQITLAIFLVLLGLMDLWWLSVTLPLALGGLLVLFILKIPLAFAVRWYETNHS